MRFSVVTVFLLVALPSSARAEESCIFKNDGTCWPKTCAADLGGFEQIRTRMPIWDVRTVFNCRGSLISRARPGGYGKQIEMWRFSGKIEGTGAIITTEANRVVDTMQIGLE